MRETYNLEFKKKVTDTFLKTVTAFANYDGGKIIFGISDNGEILGLENPYESALAIENKINDTISPKVSYSIEINEKTKVLELIIYPGEQLPYFYRSKTYKRNDSSTLEVDSNEIKRLILKGKNLSYDKLNSNNTNLQFDYLENKLREITGIDKIDKDVLKTLELMNKDEIYTNAGSLLADKNEYNIIDIVRFGEDEDTILSRYQVKNISILESYDFTVDKYREYYQFETIRGAYREKTEIIPENALREAVANALVHRDWIRKSYIQISMHKDKIVIISPGALPTNLSEREYLESEISILRNPIIANVFFRLDIIESFGTEIRRIKNSYRHSKKKPIFKVFENSVEITLPVISDLEELSDDQNALYSAIKNNELPSSELSERTGFGKNKVLEIIESLINLGYVQKIGRGRGTKYRAR